MLYPAGLAKCNGQGTIFLHAPASGGGQKICHVVVTLPADGLPSARMKEKRARVLPLAL